MASATNGTSGFWGSGSTHAPYELYRMELSCCTWRLASIKFKPQFKPLWGWEHVQQRQNELVKL